MLVPCSLLTLFAVQGTLQAQVGAGSLSGTVVDASGAVVPGARAVLHNDGSGADRSVSSGNGGAFTFAAIPAGDYTLNITRQGFETYQRTAIHLNAGDALTLDKLQLVVGTTKDTVTVESNTAGLPLDSGQLSSTITAADLDRLSIVGRDATELQRILPGFAIRALGSQNTAPDFSQVTIGQPTPYASNGSPVAGITLKLDGAILTDPGNMGSNLQNINDAFVSEVQVQTSNFGADQAYGPVLISGVTRAGTERYHGSAYIYGRTNQLNSNDSLAKYDGIPRPNDRFIYPGGTISGPIPHVKNLTFFSGAEYDAQKNVYAYGSASSAIIQALVPTAAMRAGDFSQAALQSYLGPKYFDPNNPGKINPVYAQIAPVPTFGADGTPLTKGNIGPYIDKGALAITNAQLPLPNLPLVNGSQTNVNGFNYQALNLVDNNILQLSERVDYSINPKNIFFIRYSYERGVSNDPQTPYFSPQAGSILGSVNTPGGGLTNHIAVHSASANYVNVLTPTLTNEFYATGTYFYQTWTPKTLSALQKTTVGDPYNGVFSNGSTQFPQFYTFAEYGGLPLSEPNDFSLGPLRQKKFLPNGGDNITKVFGGHTLRAGFFLQHVGNDSTATNGQSNGAIQNYYFGPAGTAFHSYNGTYPNGTPAFNPATQFTSGNTLANWLEGQVQDYHQDSFLPSTNLYFWNTDFYGQDAWKVKQNFVLTVGVRFSHLGAWTDKRGIGAAIFTPETITSTKTPANLYPGFSWHGQNSALPNSGTGSTPMFYQPRVGFAWDLFSTGKTVLRGGVGVYRFHDAVQDVNQAFVTAEGLTTADLQGFGGNTLAGVSSVMQNGSTYGTLGGTQNVNAIASITGLNANDHTDPVTNNYSLSVAQQLPKSSVLQISYVGNNSNSLLNNGTTQAVILNNVNAIPVGTLFTPAAAAAINSKSAGACNTTGCTPLQAQALDNLYNYPGDKSVQNARPYPEYGNIVVPAHNTYANYNALQVLYVKQTGHLTFNANYTFSKALSVLGSAANLYFTASVDPFNLQSNYGPSNFDRSQTVNLSYAYQFGRLVNNRLAGSFANNWLISGITTYSIGPNLQTGVSYSPSFYLQGTLGNGATAQSVNNLAILGTPDVNLQPTVKCDLKSNLAKNQYINASCLGVPAVGTNGRAILPYVHGPSYYNTDLTLEKGFSVGGERKLRVRYAAFNFLNHPLHSFGTGYASQTTLNLSDLSTGATNASATNPAGSGFGFAPLTIGRRLSEVSLRYDF